MKIIYYRDITDIDGDSGPIMRFFKDLLKKDPQLWEMVRRTLVKIGKSKNLNDLMKLDWVSKLSNLNLPIYELKIPPKKRRKGVARLYFGYKKNDINTIVVLSAEKKHGRIKSSKSQIKLAETRYKEVCI